MREAHLNQKTPGAGAGHKALRQRAEALASTLPPLLVEATRVAATVEQGIHGRRRVGRGEAFWQFRRYSYGDPVQTIDWRQSAKSDFLYIREKEWEAAESVWLWRDESPSMRWHFAKHLPDKIQRADLLLLALAALLVRGGERIALLGTGERPLGGQYALNHLTESLMRPHPAPAGGGNLPPLSPLPRFARVVMISDFLSPVADFAAEVAAYSSAGATCHLLQILDPAEETLPFRGRVRFEGLEGEQPYLVSRVENLRAAYAARIRARKEELAELARRTGGTYALHRTDKPPQTALLALYEALAQGPTGYMRT
jgi:uncharacterized protein (DUF58 family)